METREKVNDLNQETAPEMQRTRRVGSVTFGLTLVLFGILFLVHIVLPKLHYAVIFRMWPVVFILLGVEILAENHRSDAGKCKMIYDFPAILMLMAMLLFAMLMAAGDAVSFSRISCVPAG